MLTRRDFLKLSAGAAIATIPFGDVMAFSFEDALKHRLISSFTPEKEKSLSGGYYKKIKNFNKAFDDDLFASSWEFSLIKSCRSKTYALMRYIGFGNFNIVNFDDARRIMASTSKLHSFTKKELTYLDMLFNRDASCYGFYGERIFTSLTDRIERRDTVKIPRTGHYLYNGESMETYQKITKEMRSLTLTSGVRSVVKQLHLFLNKAVATRGNLSMASRSIAPVGYSYHGIGDFDVGIKGWGQANFTNKFATTREYSKLMKNGYMRIRYDKHNPYGVRFEPWHVKVV